PSLASKIVSTFAKGHTVARVNILRQVRTDKGWRNAALPRKQDGRIKWPAHGRYLIEWRENGRRVREARRHDARRSPRSPKTKAPGARSERERPLGPRSQRGGARGRAAARDRDPQIPRRHPHVS